MKSIHAMSAQPHSKNINFEIRNNNSSLKEMVSLKIRNVNFSDYQTINDEMKS